MDLSDPSGVVLPRSTSAVLRVLAGTTTPMPIRQVARLAGVSHARANQVIGKTAEHGLVTVERAGTANLCSLNRLHLAADAVVALVTLRAGLVELLKREVNTWEISAEHVSLFGSAARGDGSTSSDLDILVISRGDVDDQAWEEQLAVSGDSIRSATGNHVAWFSIGEDDLGRSVDADEPVVESWLREGVHISGVRLQTILRRVS